MWVLALTHVAAAGQAAVVGREGVESMAGEAQQVYEPPVSQQVANAQIGYQVATNLLEASPKEVCLQAAKQLNWLFLENLSV